MAEGGGAAERTVEAPPPETESIMWSEDKGRFETPDGEAFLQYRLLDGNGAPAAAVMDMVPKYVPWSKHGQGLTVRLCDATFAHMRQLLLHLAGAPLRATEHRRHPVAYRIGGAPHHIGSSSPPPHQSASGLQAMPLHGQAHWWSLIGINYVPSNVVN